MASTACVAIFALPGLTNPLILPQLTANTTTITIETQDIKTPNLHFQNSSTLIKKGAKNSVKQPIQRPSSDFPVSHLASLLRKRSAPAESKPRSIKGRSGFTLAAGTCVSHQFKTLLFYLPYLILYPENYISTTVHVVD